jgi:tetratricopeptide (TPR) repeat protein
MADVIRVGCPQCKAVIQIRAEQAGLATVCPKCQMKFKVPGAAKPPSQPKIVVKPPRAEGGPPPPEEPVKDKKPAGAGMPFSITAIGMWAGAAVLFAVSALMIYSSIGKFSLKTNAREALKMHDSGNTGQVGALCEKALGWNSSYHPARELWAKTLVDSGADDVAEDQYNLLIRSNYKKPSVYAGLGVLYLKKADKEADPAKAATLIAKAQEFYGQARSIPEGEIGLGMCALMLGIKQKNAAKLKEARGILEGAAKNLNDKIGRDGLVDLYFSLGVAQVLSEGDLIQAEENFNRAGQFDVIWTVPQSHILLIRARHLAEKPLSTEDYKKRHEDIKHVLEENLTRAANPTVGEGLLPATREYMIACLTNFIKHSDYDPVTNYIPRLRQHAKDQFETVLSLNVMWVRFFDSTDPRLQSVINNRALPLAQELVGMADTAKQPPVFSIAINNAVCYGEYIGWTLNVEPAYPTLVNEFKRATDQDPKNYAAWRNMAVILKRAAKAERLPDKKTAWFDQCQAALKKAEEVAAELKIDWMQADLTKLQESCKKP